MTRDLGVKFRDERLHKLWFEELLLQTIEYEGLDALSFQNMGI